MAIGLCVTCGEPVSADDRWIFESGGWKDDVFLHFDGWNHSACAIASTFSCPHLRKNNLKPFPVPRTAQLICKLTKLRNRLVVNTLGLAITRRDFETAVEVQYD